MHSIATNTNRAGEYVLLFAIASGNSAQNLKMDLRECHWIAVDSLFLLYYNG